MTGGVLSSTVNIWVQVVKLPQLSAAVHVRVIVYSCRHPPAGAVVISLNVTNGTSSQLSVAVALACPAGPPATAGNVMAEHSIVTSSGQLIAGAVESSTVRICVHVETLPQSSAADQILVIIHPPYKHSEEMLLHP